MPKVPYPKQIQTFANQIGILKQRGMTFADEAATKAWLHRVSYYRMSGYWYPLLADRVNHTFKPGATFEQAVSLYEFDSRLRELVFRNIGRIEVAVRTQMAYVMSMAKGGTWFADASLFTNTAQHAKTLQSIADEYHRSDEQFVRAFKRKYSDPLPPSWMTLEVTSFGTMSILYQYLKPGISKRDVAAVFGVSDTVFASWLHTLVYVRNICATFIAQPATGTQRVYFVLAIIRYWLNVIDSQNTLTQDLQQLFSKFPSVHAGALGFPQNWEQEQLWQ